MEIFNPNRETLDKALSELNSSLKYKGIVTGAVQPAVAIVFSKVITVFQECDKNKQKNDILLFCLLFILIGVTAFFSNFIQVSLFVCFCLLRGFLLNLNR
jgi:hypothetical protein